MYVGKNTGYYFFPCFSILFICVCKAPLTKPVLLHWHYPLHSSHSSKIYHNYLYTNNVKEAARMFSYDTTPSLT